MGNCCSGYSPAQESQNLVMFEPNVRNSTFGRESIKRDSIIKEYNNNKENQNFDKTETYQTTSLKREIPPNKESSDLSIEEKGKPPKCPKKDKLELNDGVLSKFKYVFEDEPKMKRPTSKSKIKNSLKEKKEYIQCDISEIYNSKN